MDKENEDLDSLTEEGEEKSEGEEESDDLNALKGKLAEVSGKNKQLFERAKKAETELKTFREKNSEGKTFNKSKQSDGELLERIDELALQVAGINEDDEVALYNTWKGETGRDAKAIVNNQIFKAELEKLRVDKANVRATAGLTGGGTEGKAVETAEYWASKKDYPSRQQIPNSTVRRKIAREMLASSKGKSKTFYNE